MMEGDREKACSICGRRLLIEYIEQMVVNLVGQQLLMERGYLHVHLLLLTASDDGTSELNNSTACIGVPGTMDQHQRSSERRCMLLGNADSGRACPGNPCLS